MTLIKPQGNDFYMRWTIFVLVILVLSSAVVLVFLYNKAVNTQHAMVGAQQESKRMETENAELQDKVFSIFAAANVEQSARDLGLVKDRSPQYLGADSRWALASHF